MLRFFHGMEYVVDDAENQIINHIKYMEEHDLWHVEIDRIPNIIDEKIFFVHKEDKYERPITYVNVGKFHPSQYEFDELRDYCFWHYENIRKAFKPHVECHLGIYDMKGLGRKNFNMAILK